MEREQKRDLCRILTSGALLLAAIVLERFLPETPLVWRLLLFLPAYLLAGADVLLSAARRIVRGNFLDETFLMSLATLGALSIGFLPYGKEQFAEGVFVMIFYQTGEFFQELAVGKSRRSIASLMELRPDTARVLRDGKEVEVSPEEVEIGEEITVRAGEKISLDGIVTAGKSDLDTVALTGESLPRAVDVGDSVISGCTNLSGKLTVRVVKRYADSTVAKILELMSGAAARKSKSERFISRFAKYYTPFVVLSAICLAFLPPLFSGAFAASFARWLSRALVFLIVSCPCALVISVPLSFFGGMGGASRMGVLIKSSDDLESLAATKIVAFDKTGTLTHGNFTVVRAVGCGISDKELLRLAASAESSSNHPVALALTAAAPDFTVPDEVREYAGRGIVARIGNDDIAVGNAALMTEIGVTADLGKHLYTTVFVAKNKTYCGFAELADAVKENAPEAIAALRFCGVKETVMLTGDRADIAADVAKKAGVDRYYAELLPAQKVEKIEELLASGTRGKVAFIGDGINDAPVLSRADVGVAMGALGSDAAIEAADVVLMDDDLTKLARAKKHAEFTLRIVRENIVLALAVKAVVLAGSAFGLFGAWQMPLAVFADVGVAVLAILNAMRTMRARGEGRA